MQWLLPQTASLRQDTAKLCGWNGTSYTAGHIADPGPRQSRKSDRLTQTCLSSCSTWMSSLESSWWMHTKSENDASRCTTTEKSLMRVLFYAIMSHVEVFQCNWTEQHSLCHHRHCIHWIDTLRVGWCFMFALLFPRCVSNNIILQYVSENI